MPFRVIGLVLLLGSCSSNRETGIESSPSAEPEGPEPGSDPEPGDSDAAEEMPVLFDSGPGFGVPAAEATTAFLGIPYARPPTGPGRFSAPEPPEPWTEPRDFDQFPPACPQLDGEDYRGDEDCLFLNVWRPDVSTTALPIMVFVHGGGNISGSTTEMQGGFVLYDGARLAARENVIVVTVQYRLGALGYLVDSALDDGAPSGNYGLRDLVAALQWVQRNAAALGGDAERVMLFGESGGGTNVCALLATPSAADLFSSAIVMSGGCAGAERDAVAEWSRDVRTAVQCDGTLGVAECLRAADAESLVRAAGTLSQSGGLIRTPAGPTIDGDFLPKSPRSAFEAGEQSQVPVVFGVTAQETASLLFGIPLVPDYEATVRLLFARSGAADEVLARYPLEDYASPRDALVDLTTDLQFVCPAAFASQAMANTQSAPVFFYVYSHVFEGSNSDGAAIGSFFGAAHGFELVPLFQGIDRFDGYQATDTDRDIQSTLAALWAGFARGNPSPSWPAITSTEFNYLDLRVPVSAGVDYHSDSCEFLASLGL